MVHCLPTWKSYRNCPAHHVVYSLTRHFLSTTSTWESVKMRPNGCMNASSSDKSMPSPPPRGDVAPTYGACVHAMGMAIRCGARLGGSNSNAVNLILRLFLYHFLHTMSSWRHKSIHNNTNNQQTPPPWWWSRSPLQQHGFNESMTTKWQASLRMYFPRPLLKGALGLLANLKETREVKWACWVEATSIMSVVMSVVKEWCLWCSNGNYET